MSKKAGILYCASEFKNSAVTAQSYLKSKGYSVSMMPFKEELPVADIPCFPDKLDFMAWYSHGGWDGPVVVWDNTTSIPGQVSPKETHEWDKLITYLKNQMKPKGVFIVHSCHAAGSDSWEKDQDVKKGRPEEKRIWIRDVAKSANVYSFGQAGLAGSAHTPTVKALLEFVFTKDRKGYPFHAYKPSGARVLTTSDWPKL